MNRIWWLASYPKSGNTWFRVFLTALLRRDPEGPALDELIGGPIAAARDVFELETALPSDELTSEEIQALRPAVFRALAQRVREPLYLKIHDARVDPGNGIELIPPEATAGAIYLLRNPLDVAVSWAHHSGSAPAVAGAVLDQSLLSVSDGEDRSLPQLRQVLGDWSEHVRSWVDHAAFPVLVLRYEDLLTDPLGSFGRAVRFLRLDCTHEQLAQAIEQARFDRLQALEAADGFAERPFLAETFFRRGKAGGWRDELPPEAVQRIIARHGEVMRHHGYLDAAGNPV